jgi:hypothetical protein
MERPLYDDILRTSFTRKPLFMNTPSKSPLATLLLLAVALLCMTSMGPCNKQIPPPHSAAQFPFENQLDSLFTLPGDSIVLSNEVIPLLDPFQKGYNVAGQAEIAFAFRTSAPAALAGLALYLPGSNFTDLVTLWDSASGTVLAQANVTVANPGEWNSVPATGVNGQPVIFQPGKGYIVGFNTLPNGDTLFSRNQLNLIYWIFGYTSAGGPPMPSGLPLIPFTNGLITYEAQWVNYYETEPTSFFPGNTPAQHIVDSVYGVCDFGYVPLP